MTLTSGNYRHIGTLLSCRNVGPLWYSKDNKHKDKDQCQYKDQCQELDYHNSKAKDEDQEQDQYQDQEQDQHQDGEI